MSDQITTVAQDHEKSTDQASPVVNETVEAAPDSLPPIDPATAVKMEKNDSGVAKIVKLAIETLDPKDMLKKYAKLGKAVLDHATWQKSQFPAWADQDFARLCDKVADQVKFQTALKDVEMAKYVRVHLWVEAVRPMVPNVESLSYYQVKNKFLPTLSFSATELHGEIKAGWVEFLKTTVARQVSDSPLSIKDLDAALAIQTAKIEAERDAKLTPEKLAERAHQATVAKGLAAERDARTKITTGIDSAIGDKVLDPNQIMGIVEKVAKDRGITLPVSGIPTLATMTAAEAKLLADAMWKAGNIAAIKILRDNLDVMVKTFEAQAATLKTAKAG